MHALEESSQGCALVHIRQVSLVICSIHCRQIGHRGGAPEEVDGGGASKEEDEAIEGKDHCVPEDLKGATLHHSRTHVPLACRAAIQAKHHHCYDTAHPT